MSEQLAYGKSRLSLAAVREMDELARQFRRKLRDVAVQLSREAGHSVSIGADTIIEAVPVVCRELLSTVGASFSEQRGSNGPKEEAA